MKKYGVDMVLANELHTRRFKAYLYEPDKVTVFESKGESVFYHYAC